MDFYTIDFETANSLMTSACSIGIVGVLNNKKVLEKHYYINPMQPFEPFNITIHKINEDMVKDSPTFLELWDDIKEYFNNTIVFAHNAMFDFTVLNSLFEYYDIEKPNFKFGCTVKLARKLWPNELINYRLNTLAAYLEEDLNHHNALSDASICSDIIIRGLLKYQVDTVEYLYNNFDLKFGIFSSDKYYQSCSYKSKDNVKKLESRGLLDKVVLVIGTVDKKDKKNLYKSIYINGGFRSLKFDDKVDIIVIMEKLSSTDQLLLNEIKCSKSNIKIYGYTDFMGWINEFNN